MRRMGGVKVDVEAKDDAYVVRIQGSASALEAEKLERSINGLIARRPERVVVDLSAVTFLSSLGMGVLVSLYRSLQHFSGTVRLAAPQEMVREALERARLHEMMQIFDDVQTALLIN